MAPTLVFKGTEPGDFVMATGSPGGGTIIQYVLKTVVGAVSVIHALCRMRWRQTR